MDSQSGYTPFSVSVSSTRDNGVHLNGFISSFKFGGDALTDRNCRVFLMSTKPGKLAGVVANDLYSSKRNTLLKVQPLLVFNFNCNGGKLVNCNSFDGESNFSAI